MSFIFWYGDPIQRIPYTQSFDTVKYPSEPNEGVILYVLKDIRQVCRLVFRNVMRGHEVAELTALVLKMNFPSNIVISFFHVEHKCTFTQHVHVN